MNMDKQMTAMKKQVYDPPVVTVVEFRVEHGHESILPTMGLQQAREDFSYYSASEDFTEFTDNSGDFTTGSWR